MAHLVHTGTTITAAEAVELADRLVGYKGFPTILVSDWDTKYVQNYGESSAESLEISWRSLVRGTSKQTGRQNESVEGWSTC